MLCKYDRCHNEQLSVDRMHLIFEYTTMIYIIKTLVNLMIPCLETLTRGHDRNDLLRVIQFQ